MLTISEKLHSAVRRSKTSSFSRPRPLSPFEQLEFLACPKLTPDGLTLYFDKKVKDGPIQLFFSTRPNRGAAWNPPQKVTVPEEYSDSIRCIAPTYSGMAAFAALTNPIVGKDQIVLLEPSNVLGKFSKATMLDLPGGLSTAYFPHYCVAISELYLIREDSPNSNPNNRIISVRNFKFPTVSASNAEIGNTK